MAIVNGKYVNGADADPATGAIPGGGIVPAGTGQDYVPTPTFAAKLAPAPAPAAPTYGSADPNMNPSYRAFLAGAGASESTAKAAAARQRSNLQAQLEAQRPVWAQTLQQGLSGVLNNAAGAGTVRSSNRLAKQNLVQQGVNNQQAQYESGIANQIGNVDLDLANTLNNLQVQKAQEAMQAQQSVYGQNLQDYQNELTNYYLSQLIGG